MENKFDRKWGMIKYMKKIMSPIASVKNTASNFENKKELEGLMNIGKIKSFKDRINMEEVEDRDKRNKKIVKAIEEVMMKKMK